MPVSVPTNTNISIITREGFSHVQRRCITLLQVGCWLWNIVSEAGRAEVGYRVVLASKKIASNMPCTFPSAFFY